VPSYAVVGGYPGGSNLSHERQDIGGEAVGTRLMWELHIPYQSRKSAVFAE
jgi:hypothetical protein